MTHSQMVILTERLIANISAADADMLLAIAAKKRREEKAAKKIISDAKYFEAIKNKPVVVKEEILIAEDAAKYQHNKYGIGLFVSENENSITLSFNG